MSRLEELQELLSKALLGGTEETKSFLEHIAESESLSEEERLSIYKRNGEATLVYALAGTYPVCQKLVGEEYFSQVSRAYAREYPSDSSDLNFYGEEFSKFWEELICVREEARELFYMPDICRLEWHFYQAHFAQDDEVFDSQGFSALSEEERSSVVFLLSFAGAVLSSDYPIYRIWRANQEGRESPEISLEASPEYLFISRENYRPVISCVSETEWALLSSIESRQTFLQLAEKFGEDLGVLLGTFLSRGWVRGFEIVSC